MAAAKGPLYRERGNLYRFLDNTPSQDETTFPYCEEDKGGGRSRDSLCNYLLEHFWGRGRVAVIIKDEQ